MLQTLDENIHSLIFNHKTLKHQLNVILQQKLSENEILQQKLSENEKG